MNSTNFRIVCVKTAEPMCLDRQCNAPFNQFLKREACQNGVRHREGIQKHVCWHDCATVK